jgi:P-type E1-E2 ATPase
VSNASDLNAIAWHALPVGEARAALDSDDRGLTTRDASERLARVGANVITTREGHGAWRTLAHQFRGTLVLLLVVATAVAVLTREPIDAAAIATVLALNAALGFATEFQAHRAVRALRDLDPRRALVLRDGEPAEIDASGIVPGDVLLLEAGIVAAADGRITEAFELSTDESLLTGESLPVRKSSDVLAASTTVAERRNLIFAGTMVTGGGGRAIVTQTGAATQLGRIGGLVGAVQAPRPPIERRLERLGRVLALAAGAIILVLILLGLARHAPIFALLETSVALAVAAIPEALPAVATVSLAIGAVRMSRRNVIVRRLAAIESLGAMTTVCVDKTGTLTSGRMSVTQLASAGWRREVTAESAGDARVRRCRSTATACLPRRSPPRHVDTTRS